MTEDDEFTIPRPRWILPVAVMGAVLLLIVLFAGVNRGNDEDPVIRRTGTTVAVGPTAPATSTG